MASGTQLSRMAPETIYLAPDKTGVIALSISGDPEWGGRDEGPEIIFKAGRLPAPFEEV